MIHPKIREKMFEILYSSEYYDFLDEKSVIEMNTLRREFSVFDITDQISQRPLKVSEKKLELFTFTGSQINRTIQFLFDIAGITTLNVEQQSVMEIKISEEEFKSSLGKWNISEEELDLLLKQKIETAPGIMGFSKWAYYLPIPFQVMLLKQKHFDFKSAKILLDQMELVRNS